MARFRSSRRVIRKKKLYKKKRVARKTRRIRRRVKRGGKRHPPIGSNIVTMNVAIDNPPIAGTAVFPAIIANGNATIVIPFTLNDQQMEPVITGASIINAINGVGGDAQWKNLPYRYVRIKKIRWTLSRNQTFNTADGIISTRASIGGPNACIGLSYHPRDRANLAFSQDEAGNISAQTFAKQQPGVKKLPLLSWRTHSATYGPEYKQIHTILGNSTAAVNVTTPSKNMWLDLSSDTTLNIQFPLIEFRGPTYTQPEVQIYVQNSCTVGPLNATYWQDLLRVNASCVVTLEFKGRKLATVI